MNNIMLELSDASDALSLCRDFFTQMDYNDIRDCEGISLYASVLELALWKLDDAISRLDELE